MKDKAKQKQAMSEKQGMPPADMRRNGNGKASGIEKNLQLGKDCDYDRELRRLQIELVKLQEWIRHEGLRILVLFEGRDAAGKAAPSSGSPNR